MSSIQSRRDEENLNPNPVLDEYDMQQIRYHVSPRSLDGNMFYGMLGDPVGEHATLLIIRLFHQSNLWRPFTREQLTALNNETYHKRACISLGSLCPEGRESNPLNLIVKGDDGKYRPTIKFVTMCAEFKKRPLPRYASID